MRLFERRTTREARVYAEAQALLDDGRSATEVLALFPADAEWLAPLLEIGGTVADTYQRAEPDPEFSASLKQAFLAAARRPSFVATPEPSPSWLRTTVAATAVAAVVGLLGVLTFGLVTADQSVPGDWNYTLKITKERLEETFASGDQKVDLQIRQTEARVYELQRLSDRGALSAGDLEKLEREARQLTEMAREQPLGDAQLARLRGIFESASLVLERTREQQPELAPVVESAQKTVDEAVAATGAGPVTTITEPTPTEEPESTPTETASPAATATEPPPATEGEDAAEQPSPEATATPVPEATAAAVASEE